jgi:putative protease
MQLRTVFNRGFWGGYYLGRKLGEWSDAYGNQAVEKKTYIARVTNYFSRSAIAELKVETAPLHVGDKIMIIGPTTGVVEDVVREIRLNDVPVQSAPRGAVCSVPCAQKLRRSDKLYRIDKRG